MNVAHLLNTLGVAPELYQDGELVVSSPIDGSPIARVPVDTAETIAERIREAHESFLRWREVPPPRRGQFVRLYAEELRRHKEALGELVTIESGKIISEGLGEVQEMIDICDYAVGLSRQLYGLTIASERPAHHMLERWHPLGVVGVISAFNFPGAVWAWNSVMGWVCGDSIVWKPSEQTPLTALSCQALFQRVCADFSEAPPALSGVIVGDRFAGEILVDDPRVALISATGSTRMGREVGPRAARRFARTILELGGNAAMIVTPSADLDLALRAIVFAAVGTAGQRCTSLRRLIVHEEVYDELVERLRQVYATLTIGNPLERGVLVGPLIGPDAYQRMTEALEQARADGGRVFGGNRRADVGGRKAYYVEPAIVEMPTQTTLMQRETFAPILYTLRYTGFEQALQLHNGVPQGLASCLFTTDIREAERFLSATGSDCGIANVNIGSSGAEIGGAFGGEKETGGGRESGSDAWKAYMRRQTQTVNYSGALPLAQGVEFELGR